MVLSGKGSVGTFAGGLNPPSTSCRGTNECLTEEKLQLTVAMRLPNLPRRPPRSRPLSSSFLGRNLPAPVRKREGNSVCARRTRLAMPPVAVFILLPRPLELNSQARAVRNT